ncbi:unnamed protein product, partial [Owenia fusiformis]
VVKEGPKDIAVLSGQNAELTCHIDLNGSSPKPEVQWISYSVKKGGGRQISFNERAFFLEIPNKFSISTLKPYSLRINNVDRDDAGRYRCNDVPTGASIGNLDPHLLVVEPTSCPLPRIITRRENETVTFTWTITYTGNRDDYQKPIITWTLNGIKQTSATSDETTPGVYSSTFTKTVGSIDNQGELSCSFHFLDIKQNCSTRLNIQSTAPALRISSTVKTSSSSTTLTGHKIGLIIGLLIAIVIIFVLILLIFKLHKKNKRQKSIIGRTEDVTVSLLRNEDNAAKQTIREYQPEDIDIRDTIGTGEFGVVKLVNVNNGDTTPFKVAGKMLKENASDDDNQALFCELQ